MAKCIVVGIGCDMKRVLKEIGFHTFADDPDLIFNCGLTPNKLYTKVPQNLMHRVLNPRLVLDKLEQIKLMTEAHVPCPASTDDAQALVLRRGDWLIKPKHGTRGHRIRELTAQDLAFRAGYYAQQKIDKTREFRAHVAFWFDPPCFTIQEKKPKQPGKAGYLADAPTRLCWNLDNGWWYTRATRPENHKARCRETKLYKRVDEIAKAAVEALGYDFGAVDVVMDRDRRLYVLEINSHPGLKGPSVDIYKQVFGQLLED